MKDSYQAAIFDLDGVLVDTAEDHFLAWRAIVDEHDEPLSGADPSVRGVSGIDVGIWSAGPNNGEDER